MKNSTTEKRNGSEEEPVGVTNVEVKPAVDEKTPDCLNMPSPPVVTIHATAIVNKSPHNTFVQDEWNFLT